MDSRVRVVLKVNERRIERFKGFFRLFGGFFLDLQKNKSELEKKKKKKKKREQVCFFYLHA